MVTGFCTKSSQVVRRIVQGDAAARFGIGRRGNRVVTIEGTGGTIVPDIFQLSSGETALLDLFLSILKDSDLSQSPFASAADIRGIAIVDEIDLHLHTVHQREILPSLMQMFPNVQFVVTTHSPLFVLGIAQAYGDDGFALYRMPQGQQISPEEFSEFGEAYRAFTSTSKFSDDIRTAIRDAQSPILFLEGKTDIQYFKRAAEVLGKQAFLEEFDIEDGGGSGNLTNIWKALWKLSDNLIPRKVALLFDCDYPGDSDTKGHRFKFKTPKLNDHPIQVGVENLFDEDTLNKALAYDKAFINIEPGGVALYDGQEEKVPARWFVNDKQKTGLCDWLCENGTAEDFQHFQAIFDLLEEPLSSLSPNPPMDRDGRGEDTGRGRGSNRRGWSGLEFG